MAIERVIAEIGEKQKELKEKSSEIYSGELNAPKEAGIYSATVKAYDKAGNVAQGKSNEIEVTIWKPPKTNWTPQDRFNWSDYNRIKNNLTWLHKKANKLYLEFEIENMGEDIESYQAYWNVDFFNSWEKNLDTINKNIFSQNYGQKQTFYENGVFIQWNELNRIEGAILRMREILDSQEMGLRRISFRLGTFKEVRI